MMFTWDQLWEMILTIDYIVGFIVTALLFFFVLRQVIVPATIEFIRDPYLPIPNLRKDRE